MKHLIDETFDQGRGILRLIPVFVPWFFSEAGRRLRLHRESHGLGEKCRAVLQETFFPPVD